MRRAMDHFTTDNELIIKYVKGLKLPTVKDSLDDTIAQALACGWDYRRFLATLLQKEVDQRYEKRKYTRIHKASFPQMKYLAELVREDLPADGRNLLPEFETLDFIRAGRNIVMYGNPGTGKTHIAIGLGIKACMEGYTVYFTTVPHMLTQIREAKTDKELLFNMISTRTGDKATIITTNLPFTRWEEIIKDKVLCSALVDRLCHKAFMVNMTGPSYRVKETQNIFKKL